MANTEKIAGVDSWLLYGAETTYGTPVAVTTHLGLVQSAKPRIGNNLVENRSFVGTSTGGRAVASFSPGKLDVAMDVDFKVTRWAFLEYVLGAVSGTDPYTYTAADSFKSLTIATNIENDTTDQEVTYNGCVFDQVVIKASVGEPVMCTATILGRQPIIDTTVTAKVALPEVEVYNFTGASIEIPGGASLTNIIDSVEITIKNNALMLYGLGSRLAQKALPQELSYQIKVTLKYLDNALYTAALGATTPTATGGPTENATVDVNFVLGGKSAVFTFSGVPMSDFATNFELNKPIDEDFTLTAKTLSVVEDRTA